MCNCDYDADQGARTYDPDAHIVIETHAKPAEQVVLDELRDTLTTVGVEPAAQVAALRDEFKTPPDTLVLYHSGRRLRFAGTGF